MKQRCTNKNSSCYKNYGGKGVYVCDEWKNSFVVFKEWAIKNGYQENLEIDRILSSGNYEPLNCRFITKSENVKNLWRIKTIEDAAIVAMKEKPLHWINPLKVNIARDVFESLFNLGLCRRRIDPYNKWVYQYQITTPETQNIIDKYRYDNPTSSLYEYSDFHGRYLFACSNPFNLCESELIAEYEAKQ